MNEIEADNLEEACDKIKIKRFTQMCDKKYGRVINLTSLDFLGWPGRVNYCAAKSAIFGFTRSLALEVARDDVTINSIAIGDMLDSGLTDEEIAKLMKKLLDS